MLLKIIVLFGGLIKCLYIPYRKYNIIQKNNTIYIL